MKVELVLLDRRRYIFVAQAFYELVWKTITALKACFVKNWEASWKRSGKSDDALSSRSHKLANYSRLRYSKRMITIAKACEVTYNMIVERSLGFSNFRTILVSSPDLSTDPKLTRRCHLSLNTYNGATFLSNNLYSIEDVHYHNMLRNELEASIWN